MKHLQNQPNGGYWKGYAPDDPPYGEEQEFEELEQQEDDRVVKQREQDDVRN